MFRMKYTIPSILVMVIAATALLDVAQARSRLEPVYIPEPVPYRKISSDKVAKRIRKVAFKRKWTAKQVSATHIRATYAKTGKSGTLKAVINIKFGDGKIRFSYQDSEGFSYDAAEKTIHRRFNSWVKNLERSIRVEFGAY